MFRSRLSLTVLVAMFVMLTTASAQAGLQQPQALGDSGWSITFSDGIGVTFQGITNDRLEVRLNKLANFTEPPQGGLFSPLQITFQQNPDVDNPVPFIVIDAEEVLNNTGTDWIGFDFKLTEATSASSGGVRFDKDMTFFDDDPFDINPFTEFNFSENDTRLTLGGGVVPSGSVWTPGDGAGNGELVIFANPSQSGVGTAFVFKETPIIPLPAAAWMGLSCMLGLGVISKAKKLRRIIA